MVPVMRFLPPFVLALRKGITVTSFGRLEGDMSPSLVNDRKGRLLGAVLYFSSQ